MSQANPVSDDLVWLLTRKQTAYIHKRRGAGRVFSVERGNLKGISSPKFSGLANRATLDISSHPSGRGFTVAYREPSASPYAVKSGIETKELKGGKKEAKKDIVQLLDSIGRPELYQTALARIDAIAASQNSNRKPQRVRSARPVYTNDE
ncbi:60S ribosomal protein l28 [Rhodotorula toruloides]|uniref:60S ribosomal protein l28 n=1 Tax=Rhodotorula toruloides TaxID=5286 RepID=A0A511KME3_RHOTO|nr:60S ribosomal protein l28 [Rhodotorula toruloides]